ncbi:hypothetical protein IEE_05531 [Bacillus cereus BAG5X1-1]|uniref:DUF5658 domain-containing protein n=1 Tax=Bacillus cereus BAG5X1-1 TaxID=1053189 RepID=J8AA24_BACCE|nr:hypothetical protein [Bacillus cereus]EJQ35454.1 hypothetical protein IEE_05531 [Bacillus cereus BAG5X1-1]
MNKFFYTVGLVFCILLAFSGMVDLVQNEIMKEMVVGMLAPLKKWYISLPLFICWLGFTFSFYYRMFFEKSEKNRIFLVAFSLGGFMVYMTGSLFLAVNEMIKGL